MSWAGDRGVQKIDEPKKPLQTDRTVAKISVSVLLYKKPKISVRFSVVDLNALNRSNQTKIYYYIIFYIKYIIYNIKFVNMGLALPKLLKAHCPFLF